MLAIYTIIDWVLFIILTLCAGYLFIFAIFSCFYHEKKYTDTNKKSHFLVIFPAYAEDTVIANSIKTFLAQDYPTDYYDVITISDHQKESTIQQLKELPITTLIATYDNSSKAKALTMAINSVKQDIYDTVVILDADNLAPSNLLTELNKIRQTGAKAIQVHRKGITNDSPISVLDDVSEEINNSIFRKGHQVLGLSSALTGSGMAFDYEWFKNNISKTSTAGEDKELEAMLLKQKIHIVYSDNLYILDKKTDKREAISRQRKRWIASQFHLVAASLPSLAKALCSFNISYADKIIQWMLPPRLIQIGAILGITCFNTFFFDATYFNKWIFLTIIQIIAMIIAVPSKLWKKRLVYSFIQIPQLTLKIFFNLFRLKGASKNFSHTKH